MRGFVPVAVLLQQDRIFIVFDRYKVLALKIG